MPSSAKPVAYRPWARRLHWMTAALVITMLLAGQRFRLDLPESQHLFSLAAHSALGISLLALMVVRTAYRLLNPPPPLPLSLPAWQHTLSRLVHGLLYLMLFLVPILGLIAASASPLAVQPAYLFNLTEILGAPNKPQFLILRSYHDWSTWLLAALLGLHIAAALVHKLIWKDGTLDRMWPQSR